MPGMQPHAAARAAVDLGALVRNLRRLEEPGKEIRAVVKANAYGHGAVPVSKALVKAGVRRLAVARAEEGIALRHAGIDAHILVLGPCPAESRPLLHQYELSPVLSSPSQVEAWLATAEEGPLDVQLKVNTGMNRLGLPPGLFADLAAAIRAHPGLRLTGVMTHLADADDLDSPRSSHQRALFEQTVDTLQGSSLESLEVHIASSAGILHHPLARSTSVRPGLALFGYDPARQAEDLEPVLSVVGQVVQIHELESGDQVGYGGTWTATRPSRVGTVPIGYADGYPWRLSGRAEALANGSRVPIVGAVSMDLLAVDLTDSDLGEGEDLVFLGSQGDETIDAFELADAAGTTVYELLCGLGHRLPRAYTD